MWSLWKRQYFFGSCFLEDVLHGFSHFRPGLSLICIKILSVGITNWVKFNLFFGTFGLLLLALVSKEWSLRSFFLYFPVNPFAVRVSSPFMYFWALNRRSVMEVGGVFPSEKMRLGLLSPAWKVIIMTWSLASSISSIALLKCFTYSLNLSPSCCCNVSK